MARQNIGNAYTHLLLDFRRVAVFLPSISKRVHVFVTASILELDD